VTGAPGPSGSRRLHGSRKSHQSRRSHKSRRSPRSRSTARRLTPLLLAGLFLASGCRGSDGPGELEGYRVSVDLAPTPPVVGRNLVVLSLTDPTGAPVDSATVELEGTMTHAGMVPVRAPARFGSEGRYRVEEFEFTMGGDWILRIQVTLPDGRSGVLERQTRVVSSPGAGA
jgi:hypothetical protein